VTLLLERTDSDAAGAAQSGPTGADAPFGDREQSWLIAQITRMRGLLAAFRDDEPRASVALDDRPGEAPESALDRLVRLFNLSPFERDILVLAAAVELDGDLARLAAEILGGEDPRPTFALALAILPDGHWDALAPSSPLRRWRLIELVPGPTLPSRPMRIDERILHYLTGIPAVDERLDGIALVGGERGLLAPSQLAVVADLARTVGGGQAMLVRLDGDDVDARLDVGRQLATDLGLVPLVIRTGDLPAGGELPGLARFVDREALLLRALAILQVEDETETAATGLSDLLEAPLVVATGATSRRSIRRTTIQRDVHLPSPAEQRALWAGRLGQPLPAGVEAAVEEIAQHHRLGAAAVDGIVRELAASAPEAAEMAPTLRRLCRERARVRLDALAERIHPEATWDDLVLPAGHLELLYDIARHVRHRTQVYERWGFADRVIRGLGVTALFAGESGTGKTLAAEVLAADLELDLYRIDLSATVSKYIGETEKNLRRLFDAAEASGAVLLFDEADALFGKRGEVKDGHDRYANLEVAYLLQRMESYRGLAILTTNMRSHIDRAFLRRLRFVIQFPFPDRAQRADIWRRIFPPATPLEGIDADELARMAVAGGSIRSIALSAAFAAAEDGTAITADHVLRAARVEYAKSDRSLTDVEAGGSR
jgi:vesicle-fusing ATPase